MKAVIVLLAVVCSVLAAPVEEDALTEFINGNRAFSAAIYKGLLAENTGNLIVSTFSVESVLTLAYEGAKGETAKELVQGLSLPSTEEKIQKAYQSLLPKLKGNDKEDLAFASANKIYVQDGIQLQERFSSVAKSVFESDVGSVNFAASYDAANEINAWVESQTNKKIKNLVNPDAIGEDTKVLLVNALYLSGKWANAFGQFPTAKGTFHGSQDSEVEFMHEEEFLNYFENEELDAKFLELPIKGGDVSVVLVLPNKADGLSNLEENIEKVLQPQPLKLEGVSVDLPKFSVETEIQFVPILEKLGVQKLFSATADLSGIASDEHIYVSDVVQKAFINVTEGGIEAAAATDVVAPTEVVTVTAHFTADHPFLYYIKNEGVVIFSGRFVQPQ